MNTMLNTQSQEYIVYPTIMKLECTSANYYSISTSRFLSFRAYSLNALDVGSGSLENDEAIDVKDPVGILRTTTGK